MAKDISTEDIRGILAKDIFSKAFLRIPNFKDYEIGKREQRSPTYTFLCLKKPLFGRVIAYQPTTGNIAVVSKRGN